MNYICYCHGSTSPCKVASVFRCVSWDIEDMYYAMEMSFEDRVPVPQCKRWDCRKSIAKYGNYVHLRALMDLCNWSQ